MPDQVVTFGSDETESGDVVLNIRRRDFGRFIESLLGEPRTIEKHYEFSFLIDQNWISHLDSTVMQRLSQNKSKLVDFSCKIYFDSGVIKTLTSREALLTFGDTSNSITVGIQLAWVFLVQFPQVSVPEKQTIRFQAFSDIKYLYESEPPRRILHRVPDSSLGLTSASGLKLLIEHTELTWGEDLFNHINNLIERSVPSKGRAYTYARSFNRLLESGYFILIYFCSVVALVYAQGRDQYSRSIDQIHTAATELDKLPSAIESFSRKLDLYFQHMLDGFFGNFPDRLDKVYCFDSYTRYSKFACRQGGGDFAAGPFRGPEHCVEKPIRDTSTSKLGPFGRSAHRFFGERISWHFSK